MVAPKKEKKATVGQRVVVHSPLGFPPKINAKTLAPSLGSLSGKRIFLVDVGFENSDNFMLQLQDWFARNQPGVRTQVVRWRDQHAPDPDLCEQIRTQGDAAILGVGL